MLFPCQHLTLVLHFVCESREPRGARRGPPPSPIASPLPVVGPLPDTVRPEPVEACPEGTRRRPPTPPPPAAPHPPIVVPAKAGIQRGAARGTPTQTPIASPHSPSQGRSPSPFALSLSKAPPPAALDDPHTPQPPPPRTPSSSYRRKPVSRGARRGAPQPKPPSYPQLPVVGAVREPPVPPQRDPHPTATINPRRPPHPPSSFPHSPTSVIPANPGNPEVRGAGRLRPPHSPS